MNAKWVRYYNGDGLFHPSIIDDISPQDVAKFLYELYDIPVVLPRGGRRKRQLMSDFFLTKIQGGALQAHLCYESGQRTELALHIIAHFSKDDEDFEEKWQSYEKERLRVLQFALKDFEISPEDYAFMKVAWLITKNSTESPFQVIIQFVYRHHLHIYHRNIDYLYFLFNF